MQILNFPIIYVTVPPQKGVSEGMQRREAVILKPSSLLSMPPGQRSGEGKDVFLTNYTGNDVRT